MIVFVFFLVCIWDVYIGDNMILVFRIIFKEDGLCGFYRGLVLNFMKVVFVVSISYVVYECLRMSFGVI